MKHIKKFNEHSKPIKYFVTGGSGPGTKVVKGPISKQQAESFCKTENEKFFKSQQEIRKSQRQNHGPLRKEKYNRYNVVTENELPTNDPVHLPDVKEIEADWKDIDGLQEQFKKIFNHFKIEAPTIIGNNLNKKEPEEIDDWLDEMKSKLKENGVHCYSTPSHKGTDTIGYIISKEVLSDKELNNYDKAFTAMKFRDIEKNHPWE